MLNARSWTSTATPWDGECCSSCWLIEDQSTAALFLSSCEDIALRLIHARINSWKAPVDRARRHLYCAAHSFAARIANGFGRVIQPIRIGEQRNQFDGAKVFHRVWLWLTERLQFPGTDQDGNIIR